MSGCTNCSSGEDACHNREAHKIALVEQWIGNLYPSRTWGELVHTAQPAFRLEEVQAFGRTLSQQLRAPVYLVPTEPTDDCYQLYVLCVGRHPGAVTALCGVAPAPEESLREAYLRICLSLHVRAACVQEVRLRSDTRGGACLLEETPRDGVYDPVLLRRFRQLTTMFAMHDIEHLDMGVLEGSPQGYAVASYQQRHGVEPTYFNWLFRRDPVTTARVVTLGEQNVAG